MKKELKDQFLPTNTTWMARESLKKLKQTGSIRDYVKEFRSSILDIKDMSEVNKLFNFISRSQGWTQTRSCSTSCPRLSLSHGSCNHLFDYKVTSSPTLTQKGKGQKQESIWNLESKASKSSGGKGWKKPDTQAKEGEKATSSQATKPSGYYIYDRPHRVRDYPRYEKLNEIIAEEGDNRGSKVPTRANPLLLLNVIRVEATHKGLMYVELLTSEQKIVALVNSEATHNFILTRETVKLGLKLAKDDNKLKAVNGQAQEMHGLAKNVAI